MSGENSKPARSPHPHAQKRKRQEIICRCNNVSRQTIEDAIVGGCQTLNEIFDATTAGVGPCGGSCRRKLGPLLQHYLQTGSFPEKITEDLTGKSPAATPGNPAANEAPEIPSELPESTPDPKHQK